MPLTDCTCVKVSISHHFTVQRKLSVLSKWFQKALNDKERAKKAPLKSFFPPLLVDSLSNHVKPYWPTEATTASDSEDPGGPERLRVETKVNVELHAENKLNHASDRAKDPQSERERPAAGDSTASTKQTVGNHHQQQQPEQRKGEKKSSLLSVLTNLHQLCWKWNVSIVCVY